MSRLSFLGHSTFWGMLTNFRVVWIRGRYGGGKTALAMMLGAKLLADGYCERVVSNIKCSFGSPASELHKPSAIILDEAWMYVETRQDVHEYAGFVRHLSHYLLLPSVFSVHSRLSMFTVQRVFNAYSLGLPLWLYRWNLRDKDVKENGYFGVWRPSVIFNHYPARNVAGDDAGISDEISKLLALKGFKGTRRQQRQSSVSVSIFDKVGGDENVSKVVDELQDVISTMDDTGFTFAEGVDEIEKIARSIKRR